MFLEFLHRKYKNVENGILNEKKLINNANTKEAKYLNVPLTFFRI